MFSINTRGLSCDEERIEKIVVCGGCKCGSDNDVRL